MTATEVLTLERIRKWLESKNPNYCVGVSQSVMFRLLNCFLEEVEGVKENILIGDGRLITDSGVFTIPKEVADFLDRLDWLPEYSGIRTEVALRVLEGDLEGLPMR